jgi:hypothetical protein
MGRESKMKAAPAALLKRSLDADRAGQWPGKPEAKSASRGY